MISFFENLPPESILKLELDYRTARQIYYVHGCFVNGECYGNLFIYKYKHKTKKGIIKKLKKEIWYLWERPALVLCDGCAQITSDHFLEEDLKVGYNAKIHAVDYEIIKLGVDPPDTFYIARWDKIPTYIENGVRLYGDSNGHGLVCIDNHVENYLYQMKNPTMWDMIKANLIYPVDEYTGFLSGDNVYVRREDWHKYKDGDEEPALVSYTLVPVAPSATT